MFSEVCFQEKEEKKEKLFIPPQWKSFPVPLLVTQINTTSCKDFLPPPYHQVIFFNLATQRLFPFFLKESPLILENFFPPVFGEAGLHYFSFEEQNFYVLNIPLNESFKIHILIEETLWLKFPHWFHRERLVSLGKLAGEISHELKNPLSGILLYAELLQNEFPKGSEKWEWATRIVNLAQRCKQITEGLLAFGKPEREKWKWININQLIQKVIDFLSNYSLFKNIEFQLKLAPSMPEFYGNPLQLEQVFINLFTNAAEAMKGVGKIFVETKKTEEFIKIKISDTGKGIPEDILPYIFDPFFTTKKEKGTGLGLSICHGIIREHKGFIKVYNLENEGACFEIFLPRFTREALREE